MGTPFLKGGQAWKQDAADSFGRASASRRKKNKYVRLRAKNGRFGTERPFLARVLTIIGETSRKRRVGAQSGRPDEKDMCLTSPEGVERPQMSDQLESLLVLWQRKRHCGRRVGGLRIADRRPAVKMMHRSCGRGVSPQISSTELRHPSGFASRGVRCPPRLRLARLLGKA